MEDSLPTDIINFAQAKILLRSILILPQLNETQRDFADLQSGYRYDDIKNISLIDGKKGSWQESWFVIAQNYFADAFIIDAYEKEQGYPVYFAPASAGCWKLEKIADNFRFFKDFLALIADALQNNPEEAIIKIQSHTYADTELWQETIQTLKEEQAECDDEVSQCTNEASDVKLTDAEQALRIKIYELNKQLSQLNRDRNAQKIDIKTFCYTKKAIKEQLEKLTKD